MPSFLLLKKSEFCRVVVERRSRGLDSGGRGYRVEKLKLKLDLSFAVIFSFGLEP